MVQTNYLQFLHESFNYDEFIYNYLLILLNNNHGSYLMDWSQIRIKIKHANIVAI